MKKNEILLKSITSFEFLFFFFQAEDGIRDDLVTGVQTCALPISLALIREVNHPAVRLLYDMYHSIVMDEDPGQVLSGARAEERRVGKECRSRWWREH